MTPDPTQEAAKSDRPVWKALIVEDLVDDAELVLLALRKAGVVLEHRRIDTEREFVEELSGGQHWDIILCDYDVPGFGAPRALQLVRQLELDVPLIVMSEAEVLINAPFALRRMLTVPRAASCCPASVRTIFWAR